MPVPVRALPSTLATASRSLSNRSATNRSFGVVETAEARFYPAQYYRGWFIDVDDLQTDEDLAVEVNTGAGYAGITDFTLTPRNPNGRPWTRIEVASSIPNTRPVRITALRGWTEVPTAVKLAIMLQAARLYSRRHAPFGVVGNPDVGEMRLLERLDPDATTSVAAYKRHWAAV